MDITDDKASVIVNDDGDELHEDFDFAKFLELCGGAVAPTIVRKELAELPDEMLASMNEHIQAAIHYTDSWLQTYHGRTHTTQCCICTEDIQCTGDQEQIAAFAVLQPADLSKQVGAMCMPVCGKCAALDDRQLCISLATALGSAQREKRLNAEPPPDLPEEQKVLVELYRSMLEEAKPVGDPIPHLDKILALTEAARGKILALRAAAPADTPPPAEPPAPPDTPAQATQEDINALVGNG